MPTMTLDEYIETYGIDMGELAVCLMRRLEHLDEVRREELKSRLVPNERSEAHSHMLNLVSEASANIKVAKQLRESVISDGKILGTVGDVQKALLASDRCLETSAKRFSAIYSIASQQALEEAVTETMANMDDATYKKFISTLEEKLKGIR